MTNNEECRRTGSQSPFIPNYYTVLDDGTEAMDVIEHVCSESGVDGHTGFLLGNVLKYVVRAWRKGSTLGDLRKARHYLELLIEREAKQGEARNDKD